MLAAPVTAQQTIVIGDDKPSADSGGPERPDTAGVVINNDVLDSLGGPGAYAPPLVPSTPYTAPVQAGPTQAGTPGTAYRLPGSGQLVISRPSTLLFPPSTFPSSRLTVPAPPGHAARTTASPSTGPDTGKTPSRLLVPKPAAPQVAQPEPASPKPKPPELAPTVATAVPREPVTEAPEPEPQPAPASPIAPVAEPTPPPVAPIAPTAEPIAPAAPAAVAALPPEPEPAAEPPSAPSLTEELQSAPPPAEPSTPAPAAEPTPKPEATPEPEPAPSQSAALTPPGGPVSEMRLVFNDGSAELTAAASSQLDGVAKELLSNADARVQLLAYAKASAEGTSRARRLSLSRALAVRAYLIEKGIRSTRIDVRALGSGFEDGPPDRVDVLPQKSAP